MSDAAAPMASTKLAIGDDADSGHVLGWPMRTVRGSVRSQMVCGHAERRSLATRTPETRRGLLRRNGQGRPDKLCV